MCRRTSTRRPGPAPRCAAAAGGFSVLEMLVAVAVIGLVAAIGVPALLDQLSKVRLEAAATDVVNLIQQTRLRAIRDGQQYTVEVDGVNVTGQTIVGSNELNPFEKAKRPRISVRGRFASGPRSSCRLAQQIPPEGGPALGPDPNRV